MGLLSWFDRATGAEQRTKRRIAQAMADSPAFSRQRAERIAQRMGVELPPDSQRRWEAGKTDRLDAAHWAGVTGQPINADLNSWLQQIRHRCIYEAANNPLVEGLIKTYQLTTIGAHAPSLSISTQDQRYAEQRAKIWDQWASAAGSNEQLSLVEILHVGIRDLFTSGEFFWQIIDVADADSPITTKLLPIHPYRCFTPPWALGIPEVALGVKRDIENRRPLSYFISQPWIYQAFEVYTGEFTEVQYANMVHFYDMIEADQVRGVPWLAPGLDALAQLRDFKIETLDAARAAADWSILLTTNHPDSPFLSINDTVNTERRTIRHVPPGWDAKQMAPAHPGPQFVPFYEALAREVGSSVCMPLLMLLLDSSSSNYSSARFDGQMFWRGVAKIQGQLGRMLARLESIIADQALKMGMLPPAPADLHRSFVWPRAPHVDPVKEAEGERIELENGSMTYTQLCASRGVSIERMIATRKRDNELLAAAGLPVVAAEKQSTPSAGAGPGNGPATTAGPGAQPAPARRNGHETRLSHAN